jgi:hypothetical protein
MAMTADAIMRCARSDGAAAWPVSPNSSTSSAPATGLG